MKTCLVRVALVALSLCAIVLVNSVRPTAANADPASEVAAAEESVSAASAELAQAESTLAAETKAFAPLKAEINDALAESKRKLAYATSLKKKAVAERLGAKKEVESEKADYGDEQDEHDLLTDLGIGLAVLAVLGAGGAFVFSRLRKQPLSGTLTKVVGGATGLAFVGGLALAILPSTPEEPQFSAATLKLSAAAQGNPLRPPPPNVVHAVYAVVPVVKEGKSLERAAKQPLNELEESEQAVKEAHHQLASSKSQLASAQKSLSQEEKLASEESDFKEEATTIDYSQLLKNPSKYVGEKVAYTGQVFQIQEFGGGGIMLLSVTDEGYEFWDDNIWIDFNESTEATEEDIITVYGTVTGSKEYETQIGGSTFVPRVRAKYIGE